MIPEREYCGSGRRVAARRMLCAPAYAAMFCSATLGQPDFATRVVDYTPAPGQSINDASFNDPLAAIGPPSGGGTLAPNNSDLVSLGGFGGSIILAFDQRVIDDPRNRFGIDAIVFGNAFYVSGSGLRRWADAGVLEISLDANGNGLADDPWFVVAGPAIAGVPVDQQQTQFWDDDPVSPAPPSNPAWYPSEVFYPGRPASYSTETYRMPPGLEALTVDLPAGTMLEAWRGLADFTPVSVLGDSDGDNISDDPGAAPEEFYTRPDNPLMVGVDHGSAGGDGFDIAWAVEPLTGTPAKLPGFDFLRISTGGNIVLGIFGEQSTEIDAASDVRPDEAFYDLTADGECGIEDLYSWHAGTGADFSGEGAVTPADSRMLQRCARWREREDLAGAAF